MSIMDLWMNKSNQTLPALSAEQTAVMEQLASRLTGASYDKNLFSLSVQFAADAAAHINAAHRPVIVAGYSSVRAQAGDALSRLAEDMHIPVIYTDKAKGIIPCDRRYAVCTLGASEECQKLIDSADFILALDTAAELWELHASCPVMYLENAREGTACTLAEALNRIRSLCHQKSMRNTAVRTGKELFQRDMAFGRNLSFPMCPEKVLFDVRYCLALDDILITDAGAAENWVMGYYDCYQPDTCLFTRSHGTAVIGAAAAKLAKPDKHVLAITDPDGLKRSDFDAMQQLHAPAAVLVLHRPGQVPDLSDFGVPVLTVSSAIQLIPLLQRALRADHPCIISCPAKI
ncbi:hypothetical protein [Butyricicoccus sp.]|uniref:hypothetical protein n=1 Tax=Butyricicoccus sp. TaxID=2049021 RepID=UPI003F14085E